MQATISVIVPVYNVSAYLRKCVDSVLEQTYASFEIILVDDGSTDSCPQICDEYALCDSRVKVIHQTNQGLSAARNAGLDISSGRYIAFVDGDDYVSKDMLEKMLNRIEQDKSDLVICGIAYVDIHFKRIDYPGQASFPDNLLDERAFWREMYGDKAINCVVAWNKIYRSELFDGVRYRIHKLHEDEFIIHDVISRAKLISTMKDECYFYLQREESITKKKPSVGNLDKAEAAIERSAYFLQKEWVDLAEMSLIRSAGIILHDCKEVERTAAVRERIKNLHTLYRKAYIDIIKSKKASLRFRLNGFTFYLAPSIYRVCHFFK